MNFQWKGIIKNKVSVDLGFWLDIIYFRVNIAFESILKIMFNFEKVFLTVFVANFALWPSF